MSISVPFGTVVDQRSCCIPLAIDCSCSLSPVCTVAVFLHPHRRWLDQGSLKRGGVQANGSLHLRSSSSIMKLINGFACTLRDHAHVDVLDGRENLRGNTVLAADIFSHHADKRLATLTTYLTIGKSAEIGDVAGSFFIQSTVSDTLALRSWKPYPRGICACQRFRRSGAGSRGS